MTGKSAKPDAEWREQLTAEQYYVCRQKGTEPPFSGEYNDCKDSGVYRCVCCGEALFHSRAKFDSGTGWPSFTEPVSEEATRAEADESLAMRRSEVVCAHCEAHLGHEFDDGPEPTGMRYCMNSVALKLERDA